MCPCLFPSLPGRPFSLLPVGPVALLVNSERPVGPEPPPGFGAVLRAIESLRDDVREDLTALEGRVMDAVHESNQDHVGYVTVHSGNHGLMEGRVTLLEKWHRDSELAQARRDGALGMARFLIEQVSRHAPRLAGVALSIAAALGVVTGQIHVTVGS